MNMQTIAIWVVFAGTAAIIGVCIELGFRLGQASHRRAEDEKESPVSAISATTLGLLAFMLAFTFGIVPNRHDLRKQLVRDDAYAIRRAYLRSDVLPEPDRTKAKGLFVDYVDLRLGAVGSLRLGAFTDVLSESTRVQNELWDIAIAHAAVDTASDTAALYLDGLNSMINVQAMRVAVSLQARMPNGLWIVLYALMTLGMASVGYQTGIAGSRRSWAMLMLALSFSIVISLIALLDNPKSHYIPVSQQPLTDLQVWMQQTAATP